MEVTTELQRLPLHKSHADRGASWTDFRGWQLPADYGNVEAELEAFKSSCALSDRSYAGVIRITGGTAQDFLHRMTSNPVNDLQVGQGMETVIPTAEGRFVDWITVFRVAEEELLAAVSAGAADHIIEFLQGYIFFKDDVHFEKVNQYWTLLELSGPGAESIIRSHFPGDLDLENRYILNEATIHDTTLFATRINGITGHDYQILCPVPAAEKVYEQLTGGGDKLTPVGFTAYQIGRIAAGIPQYGSEITEQYMLTEAHLETALNLERGCFTGQEVIARTLNYDKVKQHLCHFELEGECDISLPVDLKQGERVTGTLTSLAYHPVLEKTLGLGYVKTKYCEKNSLFEINETDNLQALLTTKTESR